jgi:outer membrane protein OmpA-like peptidoglycan-associated protein
VLQSTVTITAQVFFQPGASAVPEPAGVILDSIAQAMADNPSLRLEVVGHCDTTESTCPSRRRADAVQQALIERGVDAARLTTRDVLAGDPVVEELGGDRAKNRRVSFVVR